ncbi:hypothetical protein ACM0P6_07290 [Komagataeibacter sucrofermentans]|uniref:Uncharacterized protein n=1 Tax=Komagataeibacter sucrofermentans TaxID=1053551 RepID=A0A318QVS3_9PROT|nr:hypothetical protein [Komagataeibacter sucrofermentans]PYD79249.1 hypothetical protein CFR77_07540 [Komagataeibacter sucrofermentans]
MGIFSFLLFPALNAGPSPTAPEAGKAEEYGAPGRNATFSAISTPRSGHACHTAIGARGLIVAHCMHHGGPSFPFRTPPAAASA